jgi:Tfp pilus assembly protein PilO
MDIKIKILACVAPYGIAAAVGFAMVQPAWEEYSSKTTAVSEKKTEAEELTTKLSQRARIQKEKEELEAAIATLRDAVPSSPDQEVLTIDLEKMALESGLDVIAIKAPDAEELRKAGFAEETSGTPTAGSNMAAGKQQLADKVKQTTAPVAAAAGAIAGAAAKGPADSVSPDGGLAKNIVQIKLLGSYKSLMTFVHKLETYQRVVAVSELHATLPKAEKNAAATGKAQAQLPDETDVSEGDDQGNPELLNISLMLTTYYLP